MKLFKLLILFAFVIYGCGESKSSEPLSNSNDTHKVVVKEVLHVSEYSYLKVDENGAEKWLAAPIGQVEIGGTYYYDKDMEMKNFESKELGRTFETIFFIESLRTSADPNAMTPTASQPPNPHNTIANPHSTDVNVQNQSGTPDVEKKEVSISREGNTISIAQLFEGMEKYNNQVVRIKGKVTKYNPAIMNVNWLHLQDGTDHNGEFDLTVTSAQEAKVDDIVVIEGTVSLNKDFGAGYVYKIIVENATITNE